MDKDLLDCFSYAILQGDSKLFDLLAKDFDKFDQKDKTSLLENTIIGAPNTSFIKHVLDYGYDINYKNEEDYTLLHIAAFSFYPETIKFLIKKGLDIEARTKNNATPLWLAADSGENVEILQAFIDAGADINVKGSGDENLLIAAAGRNPNPEITEFLLKLGFDPEERDKEGYTALLNAAYWQKNIDVFDVLLDAGANPRAKANNGDTMLHNAALNENRNTVWHIIDSFKTYEQNNVGVSCMEKVLTEGTSPEVLKLFLRKMKEEQVFFACTNSNPEILETLILSGYDINTCDSDGVSAMMYAARTNTNPTMMEMFIFYDAIWNNHDIDGRNLLHHAAANPNPAIYHWLLKKDEFKYMQKKRDNEGKLPIDYFHDDEKF